MECAGRGLADVVQTEVPNGRVTVLVGTGNNGGDGFVAARYLRSYGRDVTVLLVGEKDSIKGDARTNLERLKGELDSFKSEFLDTAVIVDCLFGTGFHGEITGFESDVVKAVNQSGLPVISADIPSGVDASSGEVLGLAVKARVTVAFHRPKVGHYVAPGKQYSGVVKAIDIGVPTEDPIDGSYYLLNHSVLSNLPQPDAESNKFSKGQVAIVGGSTGLTGAVTLSATAAYRSGAGYVKAYVPSSLHTVFEQQLTEVMTVPVEDVAGAMELAESSDLSTSLSAVDCVAIGPGIGVEANTQRLVLELIETIQTPLVIDADALKAVSKGDRRVSSRSGLTVLTPHNGELARIYSVDSGDVKDRRLYYACKAAEEFASVVVLKGDDTLIASPEGVTNISPGSAPALATAGTGDVLTGVVAAFVAAGLSIFDAASAAVYTHLKAGKLAAERVKSVRGVIASDIVKELPQATEFKGRDA